MLKFWNKLKSYFKKPVKKPSKLEKIIKKIKTWPEIELDNFKKCRGDYRKYYKIVKELSKKMEQNERERSKNG